MIFVSISDRKSRGFSFSQVRSSDVLPIKTLWAFCGFLAFFALSSCRSNNKNQDAELLAPALSQFGRQQNLDWKSVPPAVYSKVRRSVITKTVQLRACTRDTGADFKPQIHNVIVSEIRSSEVPFSPPETARLIHEVFDREITACGGEACTKVSGVSFGPDLRQELAELQRLALKSSPASGSSFDPRSHQSQGSGLARPLLLTRRETCGLGLLAAFSLLNPPAVKAVALGKIPEADQSFDLRIQGKLEDQGYTGSCHAFATAEVIRHGPLRLSIDIARYFVDYWLYRMGSTVDQVLNTEVRLQREFVESLDKKLSGLKSKDEKNVALKDWLEGYYYDVSDDPQGGWVDLDLANLQAHGAVLAGSSGLRPVTFKELGDITKAIEDARLATLVKVYQGDLEKVSDQQIKDGVRASYVKLFAIAAESKNHPSRKIVKQRLRGYKMTLRKFDQKHMEASIADFFSVVKKQPAYLSANHHGTALVGYDQARKIFIVRNSQLNVYSELHVDEVFNNLRRYAVLERKGSS